MREEHRTIRADCFAQYGISTGIFYRKPSSFDLIDIIL